MKAKEEYIVEAKRNNQDILYDWIHKNKNTLTYISEDEGCGCCVNIFRVEGEIKILETFPKEILL
ncbi:hypothetical protein [uncultured Aquimarina sp.]|uniref:hypothetical protein n=1 Tax=uncultured Aquimarina sp. TaxID=575652 RepID=UPI00261E21AD|nr:hypothetical protein [uncultured Aquimarina sp.]